jgi:DNA modification methylase
LFQDGSELIGDNPKFQKYKGQLDFVFTSPPYFNREQYSQQETQSFKSHPTYEDWRDNFLKPTLKTAYEYLKNDRYLAWNIANIKVGLDKYIPLEEDSIAIMKELGAEYKGKLKMAMSRMIGIDNETESLNAVDIDGTMVKYEPIFIFYKGL